MKETLFYVAGLHCPAEELMVRNQLERLEGIDKMRFNLMTRELTVVHTLTEQQVLDALKPLDLGVRLGGKRPGRARRVEPAHEQHDLSLIHI